MIVYLDTSALAKWYVAEAGSDAFAAFVVEVPDAVISRLAVVELRCLLARRRRAGLISSAIETLVYRRFNEQVVAGHLRVEPLPDDRLLDALRLIEQLSDMPLRTLDALHLAAAQAAGAEVLATADTVQRRAAEALGLEVAFFGADAAGDG